jgi:hypothetical protein
MDSGAQQRNPSDNLRSATIPKSTRENAKTEAAMRIPSSGRSLRCA